MQWKKLTSSSGSILKRGSVLRSPAKPPYETWVDFMLMDDWQSPSSFSLWICSGSKSGLPLVKIPKEATDFTHDGVQIDWLIENWDPWIYPDSKPDQVFVRTLYSIAQNWQDDGVS